MEMKVQKELYVKAPDKFTSESRTQQYVHSSGVKRVETKSLTGESDWSTARFQRYSEDNGRTWGDWEDVYKEGYEKIGEDEVTAGYGNEEWNPVHKHFVAGGARRVFFKGHHEAYKTYWGSGKAGFVDHSMISVRKDGSNKRSVKLIRYEEQGADYDPTNPRNPLYINHNRGVCGTNMDVLENGEIIFPIEASVQACCRMLGLDVNHVFPSCPDIMNGLIIVRGRFDPSQDNYDCSFSRPIVIGDLQSSRGVNEPTAITLPSGRIVAVFRGSNVQSKNWNTRIEPGTPAHKWYCYSDDQGKTFTEPVPWHFDDREVFYSSATYSLFIKSNKNGKVYWLGNISDHTTYGNYPRHPLCMVQIDDCGLPIKDSLTIIDKRDEGDANEVQLSNFHVLQDRETGLMEIYLNKLGQRKGYTWWADCYRYFVDVGT